MQRGCIRPLLPSGNAHAANILPGGEKLARTQRGHYVSDPTRSSFVTCSRSVFRAQAWQLSLEMGKKFGQKGFF